VEWKLIFSLTKIANDPEFKANMENLGMTVDFLNPFHFKNKWLEENERLKEIVTKTGIKDIVQSKKY
jgi:hypothetical protein